MNVSNTLRLLIGVSLSLPFSGCLMRRTVTQGGQTIESGYVVERPIKDAFEKSKKR